MTAPIAISIPIYTTAIEIGTISTSITVDHQTMNPIRNHTEPRPWRQTSTYPECRPDCSSQHYKLKGMVSPLASALTHMDALWFQRELRSCYHYSLHNPKHEPSTRSTLSLRILTVALIITSSWPSIASHRKALTFIFVCVCFIIYYFVFVFMYPLIVKHSTRVVVFCITLS